MLNFLGNSKTVVGIAVTQNVGLEVGIIDKKTSQVLKYASRPLDYNVASREIENYTIFKTLLTEIYEELGIASKHDAYVVLPNVHFDFTNLSVATMNNEAVGEYILNKIEESNYIFRRVDPMTDWDDVNFRNRTDSRYVVHSSIQAQACEKIRDIIQELGGNLVGVEGAYTAILRGVDFSGIAKEFIDKNEDWSVLLVNSNSYATFTMQGSNLVDYSEYPLALKSFSPEEVYQAIANPVVQFLSTQSVTNLLIISQSDEVSADILRNSLAFNGSVITLNSNKYASGSIVQGINSNSMTLSAVGACVADFSKFPLKLNVLFPRDGKSSGEIELFGNTVSSKMINLVFGIILFILLILGAIGYFGVSYANSYYENQNSVLEQSIKQKEDEMASLKTETKVNINQILNNVTEQNLKTLAFFNSLGVDIPKSVWLSHFTSKDGNQIFVEGMATNIKDVYNYYKSLKLMVPSSNVTLSKLKMVSNLFDTDYTLDNIRDEIKLYSFAIGNEIMSNPTAQGGENSDQGASQGNGAGNSQPSLGGGNKGGAAPDINLQPINDDMFN